MCGALRQLLLQVTFIDALEIVAGELAAVVGDHVFPKPPTQQRLEVDVQDHANLLFGRE